MPKQRTRLVHIPSSVKNTEAFQLLLRFTHEHIIPTNGKAFLVGGAVRDMLLKVPPKDLDVEVYGMGQTTLDTHIRSFFKSTKIVMFPAFGVWQLPLLHASISIPRTEKQIALKHTDIRVTLDPNLTYRQASKRRDLTINSMLLDPVSGVLLDPYHGLQDIGHKSLRPVSYTHFTDDPVRAWRVVQHIGRTGFTPTPRLTTIIAGMAKTAAFSQLSGSRVRLELDALFTKAKKTGPALLFATQTGMLEHALPELVPVQANIQNIIHSLDATPPDATRWKILFGFLTPTQARALQQKLELPKALVTTPQKRQRKMH